MSILNKWTAQWSKLQENALTTNSRRLCPMNIIKVFQTQSLSPYEPATIRRWVSSILSCLRAVRYLSCRCLWDRFNSPRINRNIHSRVSRYRAVSSARTSFLIFSNSLSPRKGGKNIHQARGVECKSRFMVRKCRRSIRTCLLRL